MLIACLFLLSASALVSELRGSFQVVGVQPVRTGCQEFFPHCVTGAYGPPRRVPEPRRKTKGMCLVDQLLDSGAGRLVDRADTRPANDRPVVSAGNGRLQNVSYTVEIFRKKLTSSGPQLTLEFKLWSGPSKNKSLRVCQRRHVLPR